MRIEFTILLVATFVSIFVMAYSEVQNGPAPPEKTVWMTKPETTVEKTVWMTKPERTLPEPTHKPRKHLPHSGGLAVGSMLLPAAALLMGSGLLAYAVLRRR